MIDNSTQKENYIESKANFQTCKLNKEIDLPTVTVDNPKVLAALVAHFTLKLRCLGVVGDVGIVSHRNRTNSVITGNGHDLRCMTRRDDHVVLVVAVELPVQSKDVN